MDTRLARLDPSLLEREATIIDPILYCQWISFEWSLPWISQGKALNQKDKRSAPDSYAKPTHLDLQTRGEIQKERKGLSRGKPFSRVP